MSASGIHYQSLIGSENLNVDTAVIAELVTTAITCDQLTIANGAVNSYVLTSNSIGNATWQPAIPILAGDATGLAGSNQVNTLAGGTIAVTNLVDKTSVQTLTNKTITGSFTGDLTGNALTATTVVTNANLTGEVTSVGNATTVTNASVLSKVLTGYISGAGTVASTDTILQAIQKLNGNAPSSGVSTATANTLAMRDGAAGCDFAALTATSILQSGNIFFTQSGTNHCVYANNTNALLAGYVSSAGSIFTDTFSGDTVYRNILGSLRFGTSGGVSQLQIQSTGVSVDGNFTVNGTINLTSATGCVQANNGDATLAGYCGNSANYFTDAIAGDTAYRNVGGSLRFGTNGNNSQMQITPAGVNVTGNSSVTGNLTWNGVSSSAASNITNRGFNVTTPSNINAATVFTKITEGNGSAVVKIDIQLSGSGISESYSYTYTMSWGLLGTWARLTPDRYSGLARTIAIDVFPSTSSTSFRVARIASSGGVNPFCKINMSVIGNVSDISFLNTQTTTAEPIPQNLNTIETYSAIVPFLDPLNPSAVLMTNGVTRNITQITVPPGLWTITGRCGIQSTANTLTLMQGSISSTSATMSEDMSVTGGSVMRYWAAPINTVYVNITVNTIFYLTAVAISTSGTVAGSGRIIAIRTK